MREDIRLILETAHLPTLEIALELVNLKDKERQIVELFDLKGLTADKISEQLECSTKTIYNCRTKAFEKMYKAWKKEGILEKLMEG